MPNSELVWVEWDYQGEWQSNPPEHLQLVPEQVINHQNVIDSDLVAEYLSAKTDWLVRHWEYLER